LKYQILVTRPLMLDVQSKVSWQKVAYSKKLKISLNEAIQYHKGKKNLRSQELVIPDPPQPMKAKDIVKLRASLRVSQSIFSEILTLIRQIPGIHKWRYFMKASQETAEVFFTAFKALGRNEREAFIEKMISDTKLRRDLIDIVLIEESKKVKGTPVSAKAYFSHRRKPRRSS